MADTGGADTGEGPGAGQVIRRRAFVLHLPARQTAPVILTSPHSGCEYPPAFLAASRLDPLVLRSSEDAFVDRLFSFAPALGLPLLAARAPRAWVDLNRGADELDGAVIEGVAPAQGNPRVASGLGVIPGVVSGGQRIYARKLTLDEARGRLVAFWHPWHKRLARLIEETQQRFGMVLVLDCHSMPHSAVAGRRSAAGPATELTAGLTAEIVLGDRFGASAGALMGARVEGAFAAAGFRVTRNVPFAGAHIARQHGRPSQGAHVIQVEIDRTLYMDEGRITPRPEFGTIRARLHDALAALVADLGQAWPAHQAGPLAAE